MKRLTGIVVPIVTPLTDDDAIDVASTRKLVEHVIDGGLTCLYPCGTTGEMMYLSVDERKKVTETVIEENNGRLPVFAHVGAWNLKDTIELAKHAFSAGADGIGVVTPAFYKLSNRELTDFYIEVSKSVPEDFPVYMYAIPQNAINDLVPEVCENVAAKCANVVGVKYSFPDFTRLQNLMLVKNQTFDVLVGPDHLFEAVCAVGGKGVVSGNAMIIREHYAAVWKAICEKDYEKATALQRRTNVLNSTMCAVNNIAAYKAILVKEGVIASKRCRRPMEELTLEYESEMLAEMDRLDYKNVNI